MGDGDNANKEDIAAKFKRAFERRGKLLEECEGIREQQVSCSREGQTAVQEGKVDFHFIVFINHEGQVLELDGVKPMPVAHGKIGEAPNSDGPFGFAKLVGHVIQTKFMAKMPDELNFATLAIAPKAS